MKALHWSLAASLLCALAGCGGGTVISVGETRIELEDVIEHYRHQERRPALHTLADARYYLETFALKTLLEVAAREAGYYDDPAVTLAQEDFRRRLLREACLEPYYESVVVREDELDAWVERGLDGAVWFRYIQLASAEEAWAAYERLEAGEPFDVVARESFYPQSRGDLALIRSGGRPERPMEWRPLPRHELLYSLGTGEYSEPLFHDEHNEWLYYIFYREADAVGEEVPRRDPGRLRAALAEEVARLRRRQARDELLGELWYGTEVFAYQDLLDELDALLEETRATLAREGLMTGREELLALADGDDPALGERLARAAAARRAALDEALTAFLAERGDSPLFFLDGDPVPFELGAEHLLFWLRVDETRLLVPERRAEALSRLVALSVADELLLRRAVELELESRPELSARLARHRDELAVTAFYEGEFAAGRSRPEDDEVRAYYVDQADRFNHDGRLVYQLFLNADPDVVAEVRALIADPDTYSRAVDPVGSLAEIEERRAEGRPLHVTSTGLMRIFIAELSADVSSAMLNQVVERDETDDFTEPGFSAHPGWLSPVLEGRRGGETYYGLLHVVDLVEPTRRTLEDDPDLYDFLVNELMKSREEEEFQAFIDELKLRHPVSVDFDRAADLLDAVNELTQHSLEE